MTFPRSTASRSAPPPRRLLALAMLGSLSVLAATPRRAAAEEVTIYRDQWGVPHIHAETAAGACYGMGYAQAEDRPEEIFKQYRRATGTMAEAFGERFLLDDLRQRIWRHAEISRERYHEIDPRTRELIEAFVAGIEHAFDDHPERRPPWAIEIEPWHVVALGRYIIWGWPEGTAAGELRRAGLEPYPIEKRSSNQWLVAPDRTASGAPIALIDPHLSWYGAFRFYEVRLYGGDIAFSGVSVLGSPIPTLGHNRFLSIAMTTGGPDTSDVYIETVDPSRPGEYLYDGSWRPMRTRTIEIQVKNEDGSGSRTVRRAVRWTHHGPIVAEKGGKAYAMAIPYAEEVGLSQQTLDMITARNLSEMKRALSQLQLMEQNIMVGTVEGDIYYLRNGRVPIRPPGYDWTRPVPGHTSKTAWQGIHPLEDLVQIVNPPQGYMQNCNVSPAHLMRDSPLTPERYSDRPYLYHVDMPYLHQRAAEVLKELDAARRLTVEDAIEIAHSTVVFNADRWQRMLEAAMERHGERVRADPDARTLHELIAGWRRRADLDSAGATAYLYWKRAVYEIDDELPEKLHFPLPGSGGGERRTATRAGEVALLRDRAGLEPPPIDAGALVAAVRTATENIKKDWGRVAVTFGEMHRIGRRGAPRTYPIGGGSIRGMATPRAISFERSGDGPTYVGRGGQTATQIVELTSPPHSWSLIPLGESDDPSSPHFDDQAEKLMSPARLKPTYFLQRERLLEHVTSKTVLTWEGGKERAE